MKIAIVAPMLVEIPPMNAGGISIVINEICCGLTNRGHKVSLFCAGGSKIEAPLLKKIETSPEPIMKYLFENRRKWEFQQFLEVLRHQNEFDVIHFNYEPIIFNFTIENNEINMLDFFSTPLVLTFHNPTDIENHINYYRQTTSIYRHNFVFVGKNQQSYLPFLPNSKVIYNGLSLDELPYNEQKENYMLYLGRMAPFKGVKEAIYVSKKTGIPLCIIGNVEPDDKDFFEKEIIPEIDGKIIRYLGGKNFDEKVIYLKEARCLLFPIKWEEPFGLTMIEALACGTPVIAFKRGSVPEIIEDGINGFIVNDVDGMVEAVKKIEEISPIICRKSIEKGFAAERMICEYEKLFTQTIGKNKNSNICNDFYFNKYGNNIK